MPQLGLKKNSRSAARRPNNEIGQRGHSRPPQKSTSSSLRGVSEFLPVYKKAIAKLAWRPAKHVRDRGHVPFAAPRRTLLPRQHRHNLHCRHDGRSCRCGAVYDRSEHMVAEREISSFECAVCGATVENWNSAWVRRYH